MTSAGLKFQARLYKRLSDQIGGEKGSAIYQAMHAGADKADWEDISRRLDNAQHELNRVSAALNLLSKDTK